MLPTLQYILPWLKDSGYKLVTLDTAIAISTEGLGELTTDILAAHNQACTVEKSASYGAIDVIARAASSGSLVRQYGPGSASGSSPGKTPPHDGQVGSATRSVLHGWVPAVMLQADMPRTRAQCHCNHCRYESCCRYEACRRYRSSVFGAG